MLRVNNNMSNKKKDLLIGITKNSRLICLLQKNEALNHLNSNLRLTQHAVLHADS